MIEPIAPHGGIAISSTINDMIWDESDIYTREYLLIDFGKDKVQTYEVYLEIIQTKGIHRNNVILFGSNNKSILDEARELKKLNTQEISDVLVVTDTYHRFRARKIFDSMGFPFKYDFDVPYQTHNWYEDKKSILIVLSELMKCYLYYIFEDFDVYLGHL